MVKSSPSVFTTYMNSDTCLNLSGWLPHLQNGHNIYLTVYLVRIKNKDYINSSTCINITQIFTQWLPYQLSDECVSHYHKTLK